MHAPRASRRAHQMLKNDAAATSLICELSNRKNLPAVFHARRVARRRPLFSDPVSGTGAEDNFRPLDGQYHRGRLLDLPPPTDGGAGRNRAGCSAGGG